MRSDKRSNWRVLLLGGNSGAGKTFVAQKLVEEQRDVSIIMVDDIRIALHQATTPEQQPDLHVFLDYQPEAWENPDQIFEDWLRVGQAMEKPLKAIIAHHIVVPEAGKVIIEGDSILPSLATQGAFSDLTEFTGLSLMDEIKAVFLVEDDEAQILENLRRRGRGFNEGSKATQSAFAHASWLFGQWLCQEAQAHSLPVLASRPHETVVTRLVKSVQR